MTLLNLAAGRFGCFGKLPVDREFLVDDAAELSRSGFDEWIGEGLGLARMNLGSGAFRDLATGFSPLRFIWSMPEGTKAASGVLVPSEDEAGRIHPFAVFAWIERDESAPDDPVHPLRALAVHNYLDTLLVDCRAAASPMEALERVRAASFQTGGGTEGEDYAAFLRSRTMDEFFGPLESSLPGEGAPSPVRFQLIQALVETVGYLKGRPPIDIRLGVRVPLAPGLTATAEVAVWIDLVRRQFGSAVPGPCVFWTHPGTDEPHPRHLHFFFSRPSTAQWLSLVDPAADLESVSALERPYGGTRGTGWTAGSGASWRPGRSRSRLWSNGSRDGLGAQGPERPNRPADRQRGTTGFAWPGPGSELPFES